MQRPTFAFFRLMKNLKVALGPIVRATPDRNITYKISFLSIAYQKYAASLSRALEDAPLA